MDVTSVRQTPIARAPAATRVWLHNAALIAVLSLATGLRLYTLDLRPLWDDEAWTLSTVYRNDPSFTLAFDFFRWNPPRMSAVHLLLSLLNAHFLGTDTWSLRIPSAVLGVGAVYMTYRLGALWFSRQVGLFAALLSAINLEQITRSQEVRQYPLLLLLALSSTFLLAQAIRGGPRAQRYYLAYGAVTILMAYSHLFALFVVSAQLLYVVVARRKLSGRMALGLGLFWSVIYVPCFIVFVSSLGGTPLNTGVSLRATVASLRWLYERLVLNVEAMPILVLAIGLGMLGGISALREHRSQAAGSFLLVLALMPFGAWFLAFLLSSSLIVLPKYWIYVSPAMHLLIAAGLVSMPGRWTSSVLLLGLCAATIGPVVDYYRAYTTPRYDEAVVYIRSHTERAPVFAGNGVRVVSYYYVNEYPRLGSAAWRSFVQRVPLRPITLGVGTANPRSLYVERLAPDVHWAGSTSLDALANTSKMSRIWMVDRVSSCSEFNRSSGRFTVVDERAFAGGVRVCLFEAASGPPSS